MPTADSELSRREHALNQREAELTQRESELNTLAKELAVQHERLRKLRLDIIEQLGGQRSASAPPRCPKGPHVAATLIDEEAWWQKMLGHKPAAIR